MSYLAALRTQLPSATHVLDAFHVTRLACRPSTKSADACSSRPSTGAGHAGDPLYDARLLPRRADRLSAKALNRLQAALAAGDLDGEVAIAWWAAQQICLGHAIGDPAAGKAHAEALIPQLTSCPVPEVARLGRTLTTWQREYLAYFDTDRASNGPTEAINLLIEKIRRVGHRYRNWHNYACGSHSTAESNGCRSFEGAYFVGMTPPR